jgi:hypothetical protein
VTFHREAPKNGGGNTVATYRYDCRLARTSFFGIVPVR